MAFPTYIGKGTFTESTSNPSGNPPLPSGIQNGDLIIAVISYPVTDTPTSSDSAWTLLAQTSTGTSGNAGCIGVAVFYAIYAGSALGGFSTNASFPLKTYQTYAFRKARIPSVSATSVQSTAATSWTLPSITTADNDSFVFFAIGNDRDANSTTNVSGYTNSNLANITEIHDQTVATGLGGGLATVYAEEATPSSIGTTSCTSASSNTAAFVTFAIGPAVITADAGTYSYTGTAANTVRGWKVTADPGLYSYIGTATNTLFNRGLIADPGSYSYTGTSATLTYTPSGAFTLTADPGSYSYAGTDASVLFNSRLAADSGSYSYSGTDATLTYTPVNAYTITADPGTYSYSGTNANLVFAEASVFPTYIGKGTFTTSTDIGQSPSPPLPSGIQNGDLIIAVLTYPVTNIPTTTDGNWTRLTYVSTGTSGTAGCVGVAVFYGIYAGTPFGGFSTSGSTPLKIYQTYAFRNARKPSISSASVQSTAATSWALPGLTTENENSFVFLAIGNDRDADSTDNVSGYTNSNIANITELHDETVSLGFGGGIATVYAEDAVPGAIGTTSCTSVSSNTAAFITFAISPTRIKVAPGTYTYTGSAATLTYSTYTLTANSGTYTYTGTAANLVYGQAYTLTADSGVYAYSGTPATLTYVSGLNNILLGSSTVTSVKLGTTTVTKVYLGTTKVFG